MSENGTLYNIQSQELRSYETEEFMHCVVRAAKSAHTIYKHAEHKCEPAYFALRSNDSEIMRCTLQQYIQKFISDKQLLTFFRFIPIDAKTYACLPNDILLQQLHYVIIIVYWDVALKASCLEVLRSRVKKELLMSCTLSSSASHLLDFL